MRKWIRRIAALPLVSPNQVSEAFLWLQEEAPDWSKANEMHNYMVETWLDQCGAKFQTYVPCLNFLFLTFRKIKLQDTFITRLKNFYAKCCTVFISP